MSYNIVRKDQIESAYKRLCAEEATTDIVMFIHKSHWNKGNRGICVMNIQEMKIQMKDWRKKIRQGKLQCIEYNNKTKTTDDGRVWYILVMQQSNIENDTMDNLGLMLLGEMVDGCIYAFKSKENRDKIFEYIKS